jgi:ABC-type xylose transport system substrate-binding protein
MTEKIELLEAAIEEIDRVLLGNKDADVNEVYLKNAKRYISEAMQDTTPPFAVGEYYFDKDVERIVKIENHETGFTEIEFLLDGKLLRSVLYNLEDYFEKWQPATAEQIAEFKLAEIKNDVDIIIKNGDADWIGIVEDIKEYLTEELEG